MAQARAYFLSYARADQAVVLPFAKGLQGAGLRVWIDQEEIRPSQHWDRTVEAAVRDCAGMLVMLSPRAAASANVLDEVSVALDDGKDVIPVLLEACRLPLRLSRMQFIDATGDLEAAIARCIAHIRGERAAPTDTSAAPGPARPAFPDADLAALAKALTFHLGPIAPRLVERLARAAANREILCRELAAHIPDESDRAAFLTAAARLRGA